MVRNSINFANHQINNYGIKVSGLTWAGHVKLVEENELTR